MYAVTCQSYLNILSKSGGQNWDRNTDNYNAWTRIQYQSLILNWLHKAEPGQIVFITRKTKRCHCCRYLMSEANLQWERPESFLLHFFPTVLEYNLTQNSHSKISAPVFHHPNGAAFPFLYVKQFCDNMWTLYCWWYDNGIPAHHTDFVSDLSVWFISRLFFSWC